MFIFAAQYPKELECDEDLQIIDVDKEVLVVARVIDVPTQELPEGNDAKRERPDADDKAEADKEDASPIEQRPKKAP